MICGFGMKLVIIGVVNIKVGFVNLVVVGGVEFML